MTPFHEVLAPLLAGFTVTKVEAGDGREGDPAKITCTRGGVTRTFEVWAGIEVASRRGGHVRVVPCLGTGARP